MMQTLFAPSKINLHLSVSKQKDERGYHKVDSVMMPLALCNTCRLRVSEQPSHEAFKLAFHEGIGISARTSATWKAAHLLAERVGKSLSGLEFEVQQMIPSGGGLGSSSTDAGAVLRALCELWGLDPAQELVQEVARKTGADVAFFLQDETALFDGAGDCLRERFGKAPLMHVLLVRPRGLHIAAADAYAAFDEGTYAERDARAMRAALLARDIHAIASAVFNNLGDAACAIAPEIGQVLAWLRVQEGALCSLVSGSGACSFALFVDEALAESAEKRAREHVDWEVWRTKSLGENPHFC